MWPLAWEGLRPQLAGQGLKLKYLIRQHLVEAAVERWVARAGRQT